MKAKMYSYTVKQTKTLQKNHYLKTKINVIFKKFK